MEELQKETERDFLTQVNKDYDEILKTAEKPSTKEQAESLRKKMLDANFTMSGKPFPTFLKPLFIDEKTRNMFAHATEFIMDAVEKVAALYFDKPEYRKYFEVDEQDAPLVDIPPRYPRRVIQARLDAFWCADGSLKFLEFNCDSPSGMGWHDQLIDFFAELPVYKKMQEKYELKLEPLLYRFHDMLMTKYREFGGKKERPTFAIVCSRDSTILNDVQTIIDRFNEKYDHKTIFADPRDGEYDGNVLRMNGEVVDLIYRDAISDFTKYMDETKGTLDAFRDGKVCFINPFASRVGGLKCVLWFMTDKLTEHLFTAPEREAIRKYIPWTRFMKEGKTNYYDEDIDLFPFVSKNKDRFVLKPNSGYGGFNVTIGREVDQHKWDQVIEECKKSSWVVQEYIEIPKEKFPEFKPDLVMVEKNVNVNFFAFNGKFPGGFVRVADSSIINIHQGGGLIPMCYVKEK